MLTAIAYARLMLRQRLWKLLPHGMQIILAKDSDT
jgi:hypothetical protein